VEKTTQLGALCSIMEKTTQLGALCSIILTIYHSGDTSKENEMSEACSTCGGRRGAYWVLVERPGICCKQ
jgi:hypothetical protein